MAELIDKLRGDLQGIGNTVTFSGTDITVIAFRDNNPLQDLKTDALDKKLTEARRDIEQQKNNIKRKEAASIAAQQSFEQNSNQKLIEQYITNSPGDIDAISSLIEKEGKFQATTKRKEQDFLDAETELFNSLKAEQDLQQDLDKAIKEYELTYFKLGAIHTISYSSFREKFAVRTLGRVQAKAYTRGPRTIAGTMVFSVFQQHELYKLIQKVNIDGNERGTYPDVLMLDQIYPFNLLLLFANEYGAYSALTLFDVDIQSEGQEMSIDSIVTHNTMNFYAKEMVPMMSLGNRFNTYDQMILGTLKQIKDSGYTSSSPISNKNSISKTPADDQNKILEASRGLF